MKSTKTSLVIIVATIAALLIVGALIASWVTTFNETKAMEVPRKVVSHDTTAGHAEMTVGSNSQNSRSGIEKAGSVSYPASTQHFIPAEPFRTVPIAGNTAQASEHEGEAAGVSVSPVQAAAITRSVVSQETQASRIVSSESPSLGADRSFFVPSTSAPASAAIPIPAVFGNPAAAGITSPEQAQQIAQIASDFTKTVESAGVAPNSPAYQHAWNSAASTADVIYKQQYGWQAFEAMQRSTTTP